jgi:hypothetical protein
MSGAPEGHRLRSDTFYMAERETSVCRCVSELFVNSPGAIRSV